MYYNDGVFPYIPKEIQYLDLAVGYNKDRDTMTVEVTDISFEPSKDKEGNAAVISYDEEDKPYKDENGDFTMWNIVFHLGDVGFGDTKRIHNILTELNGSIYLVIGNHDWRNIVSQHAWRFRELTQQINMKIGNTFILLNHYPMLCYAGSYRKENPTYQLFGHVHTSPYSNAGLDTPRLDMLFPTQYDVGVDNNDFTPISWKEVNEKIKSQILISNI